jgi:hypothetical protein
MPPTVQNRNTLHSFGGYATQFTSESVNLLSTTVDHVSDKKASCPYYRELGRKRSFLDERSDFRSYIR